MLEMNELIFRMKFFLQKTCLFSGQWRKVNLRSLTINHYKLTINGQGRKASPCQAIGGMENG